MKNKSKAVKRIAVLCGGGPAPGLNAVICSIVIEAIRCGMTVFGIYDGFKRLAYKGKDVNDHLPDPDFRNFTIDQAEQNIKRGGSIIRISRLNPTNSPHHMDQIQTALKTLAIDALIVIGGDDTLYTATQLGVAAPWLKIIHIPKTIDNDLPLPNNLPTFGYATALDEGVRYVLNIHDDASTTGRHCHIIVTMGRGAGFLPLGIGKGAGAHLTLIPEEFYKSKFVRFETICDIAEGTIIKRLAMGKKHMIIVLAEGLLLKMAAAHLQETFGPHCCQVDEHGNIHLRDIELGRSVADELRNRCSHYTPIAFIHDKVGYALRGADPIAFDLNLCRDLGYGAVQTLKSGQANCMITSQGPIAFTKIRRNAMGRIKTRSVDITATEFKNARGSMTRLEKKDFQSSQLSNLAKLCNLTPKKFREKFGYLV